jgi:hypothetical protein
MMVGERKPGVGGEPLAGQDLRPKNSVYPRGKPFKNRFKILIFYLKSNVL